MTIKIYYVHSYFYLLENHEISKKGFTLKYTSCWYYVKTFLWFDESLLI